MNSDDLPSYPTPQQATYSMPPSGPRRPVAYSSNSAPTNNGPPSHPEYKYQQRPIHTGPVPQNPQYSKPPQTYSQPHTQPKNQNQNQNHQYYSHPPPPQHSQNGASYHHAYQHTGGYSNLPPQHQQPPQAQTQAQTYYQAAPPIPVSPAPPVPVSPAQPRVPSAPSGHYGSAPSPAGFHQHVPPASGAPGTRSASYSDHVPSKKPPPNAATRSRETVAETPKISSKQRLEAELRSTFDRVDTNRSGRISARELSTALVNFDNSGFQHSTVRLMIKLFSHPTGGSASSSLNFEQFVSLWKYLTAYKKLFVAADVNKSGDISFGEFQRIIEQIGYKLNVDLVLHLFQKFANKESFDDGSVAVGKLKFDAFIELLVYLRKLTDIFKQYDKSLTGVATIDYSDFLLEISNLT